jgi:hypothetical protein
MDAKIAFLKEEFIPLLRQIPSDTPPQWGNMTLQQMVEHFSDVFRVASGRWVNTKLFTPEEKLQGMREYLMSDKPYPKNLQNPLLPKDPVPVRNTSIEKAFEELEKEMKYFFAVFEENHQLTTLHPYFGQLDYPMNVQALYKHALHHLRQFGVEL